MSKLVNWLDDEHVVCVLGHAFQVGMPIHFVSERYDIGKVFKLQACKKCDY